MGLFLRAGEMGIFVLSWKAHTRKRTVSNTNIESYTQPPFSMNFWHLVTP